MLSCDLKRSRVPTILVLHKVCMYMCGFNVHMYMYLNVSTSSASTTIFVIYIIDLTPFVPFLCKMSNCRYCSQFNWKVNNIVYRERIDSSIVLWRRLLVLKAEQRFVKFFFVYFAFTFCFVFTDKTRSSGGGGFAAVHAQNIIATATRAYAYVFCVLSQPRLIHWVSQE